MRAVKAVLYYYLAVYIFALFFPMPSYYSSQAINYALWDLIYYANHYTVLGAIYTKGFIYELLRS